MSKRNIAITVAAIVFLVAGYVYSQQSGSDAAVSENTTTEAQPVINSAVPEAIPASVSTDNAEKTNAADNAEQNAVITPMVEPVSTDSE